MGPEFPPEANVGDGSATRLLYLALTPGKGRGPQELAARQVAKWWSRSMKDPGDGERWYTNALLSWLSSNKSPLTIESYARSVCHFFAWSSEQKAPGGADFPMVSPHEVIERDVQDYKAWLEKPGASRFVPGLRIKGWSHANVALQSRLIRYVYGTLGMTRREPVPADLNYDDLAEAPFSERKKLGLWNARDIWSSAIGEGAMGDGYSDDDSMWTGRDPNDVEIALADLARASYIQRFPRLKDRTVWQQTEEYMAMADEGFSRYPRRLALFCPPQAKLGKAQPSTVLQRVAALSSFWKALLRPQGGGLSVPQELGNYNPFAELVGSKAITLAKEATRLRSSRRVLNEGQINLLLKVTLEACRGERQVTDMTPTVLSEEGDLLAAPEAQAKKMKVGRIIAKRDWLAWMLMLTMGLRAHEVCGLRKGDFETVSDHRGEERLMLIIRGKGGHTHRALVSDEVWKAVVDLDGAMATYIRECGGCTPDNPAYGAMRRDAAGSVISPNPYLPVFETLSALDESRRPLIPEVPLVPAIARYGNATQWAWSKLGADYQEGDDSVIETYVVKMPGLTLTPQRLQELVTLFGRTTPVFEFTVDGNRGKKVGSRFRYNATCLVPWDENSMRARMDVYLAIISKNYSSEVASDLKHRMHPHALRHAFATRLALGGGGGMEAVREALRHSSTETSKVYVQDVDRQVAQQQGQAGAVADEPKEPKRRSRSRSANPMVVSRARQMAENPAVAVAEGAKAAEANFSPTLPAAKPGIDEVGPNPPTVPEGLTPAAKPAAGSRERAKPTKGGKGSTATTEAGPVLAIGTLLRDESFVKWFLTPTRALMLNVPGADAAPLPLSAANADKWTEAGWLLSYSTVVPPAPLSNDDVYSGFRSLLPYRLGRNRAGEDKVDPRKGAVRYKKNADTDMEGEYVGIPVLRTDRSLPGHKVIIEECLALYDQYLDEGEASKARSMVVWWNVMAQHSMYVQDKVRSTGMQWLGPNDEVPEGPAFEGSGQAWMAWRERVRNSFLREHEADEVLRFMREDGTEWRGPLGNARRFENWAKGNSLDGLTLDKVSYVQAMYRRKGAAERQVFGLGRYKPAPWMLVEDPLGDPEHGIPVADQPVFLAWVRNIASRTLDASAHDTLIKRIVEVNPQEGATKFAELSDIGVLQDAWDYMADLLAASGDRIPTGGPPEVMMPSIQAFLRAHGVHPWVACRRMLRAMWDLKLVGTRFDVDKLTRENGTWALLYSWILPDPQTAAGDMSSYQMEGGIRGRKHLEDRMQAFADLLVMNNLTAMLGERSAEFKKLYAKGMVTKDLSEMEAYASATAAVIYEQMINLGEDNAERIASVAATVRAFVSERLIAGTATRRETVSGEIAEAVLSMDEEEKYDDILDMAGCGSAPPAEWDKMSAAARGSSEWWNETEAYSGDDHRVLRPVSWLKMSRSEIQASQLELTSMLLGVRAVMIGLWRTGAGDRPLVQTAAEEDSYGGASRPAVGSDTNVKRDALKGRPIPKVMESKVVDSSIVAYDKALKELRPGRVFLAIGMGEIKVENPTPTPKDVKAFFGSRGTAPRILEMTQGAIISELQRQLGKEGFREIRIHDVKLEVERKVNAYRSGKDGWDEPISMAPKPYTPNLRASATHWSKPSFLVATPTLPELKLLAGLRVNVFALALALAIR